MREVPWVGKHRQGVVRPPYVPPRRNLPWSPMPKVCVHDLLNCLCRPASCLTQPTTPEVLRGA